MHVDKACNVDHSGTTCVTAVFDLVWSTIKEWALDFFQKPLQSLNMYFLSAFALLESLQCREEEKQETQWWRMSCLT